MKMMKCVVKEQPGEGHIILTERPIPEIGDFDVLIRVKASAICGTDVHIGHWDEYSQKRMHPPVIIGHEYAGEVAAAGKGVTSVKTGDIVTSDSHLVCNACDLCLNGHENVCLNTSVIGVMRDGSFAEYISIPEKAVVKCNPDMPIEQLALMEPLGVAVHCATQFPVAMKKVAVAGCGPIGCMGIAVAKKLGAAKVIAVEVNGQRAQMALDMGADIVINPMDGDVVEMVREASGGLGVDVVLDFSGNAGAVQAAMEYTKPEGCISAAGIGNKPLEIQYENFITKGLCFKGVSGREIPRTWEQMKGLFEAGLDISRVITHTLPLESYAEGLELMEKGQCGKVVLKP